jgi:hypothetical protein
VVDRRRPGDRAHRNAGPDGRVHPRCEIKRPARIDNGAER